MKFWDFFRERPEKVKVKNLTITYYEVHQVLNKLSEEYSTMSKTSQGSEAGVYGKLIVGKIRNSFKSFIKKKYGLN